MSVLQQLAPYTVAQPQPLIGAETIQIIIMREILDYTVLRTEETRELNTVTTPLSIEQSRDELRVAFLASKQKAAESRELEQMLRTAARAANVSIPECYLKDYLCLQCPRCALYGATNVRSASEKTGNIKHRIEYGTAFSLMPFRDIGDTLTFNAIDEMTQTTGQALGTRYVVKPASIFPSVVTLRSVTERELVLTLKTLLACRSYGAEARTGGDARNTIYGIACGWEEIITPLELTLELYDRASPRDGRHSSQDDQRDAISPQSVYEILQGYKPLAGNVDRVTILEPDVVDALVREVADTSLDGAFLNGAYEDVRQFRSTQTKKR